MEETDRAVLDTTCQERLPVSKQLTVGEKLRASPSVNGPRTARVSQRSYSPHLIPQVVYALSRENI